MSAVAELAGAREQLARGRPNEWAMTTCFTACRRAVRSSSAALRGAPETLQTRETCSPCRRSSSNDAATAVAGLPAGVDQRWQCDGDGRRRPLAIFMVGRCRAICPARRLLQPRSVARTVMLLGDRSEQALGALLGMRACVMDFGLDLCVVSSARASRTVVWCSVVMLSGENNCAVTVGYLI